MHRHREQPVALPQRDHVAGVLTFRNASGQQLAAEPADLLPVQVADDVPQPLRREISRRDHTVLRERVDDFLVVFVSHKQQAPEIWGLMEHGTWKMEECGLSGLYHFPFSIYHQARTFQGA